MGIGISEAVRIVLSYVCTEIDATCKNFHKSRKHVSSQERRLKKQKKTGKNHYKLLLQVD